MKVDRIEVFPVSVPYRNVEKNSSGVSRSGVSDVIVKVTTDDGCVGWGESTRTSSAEVIIKTLQAMVPVLLNQDPWQNQHHERNVYHSALWNWSPNTANLAYGGIDMALWDIYGKQTGKPIYQLLGGSLRDEIEYFFYLNGTNLDSLREQCEEGIGKGYTVFYLKVGVNQDKEEEMIKLIRSVIGPKNRIRLDANMSWNIVQAKRLIGLWHNKYDIDFVEAPVKIEPISLMQDIKNSVSASLCVNEGLWKESEFIDIVDSRCGDYLCCSHYYVGSIRKFLHLAYLADYRGWRLCKHTHGELGLTAAIGQHLMLSVPNACEGHQQTAQHMVDDILTEDIPISNSPVWGTIDGPGLGVEVDENKLAYYHRKYIDDGEFLPYGDRFPMR
jgi:L-alanine-DL-glutamate epimerase-like enolase superfamily enzyme